ncbi:MAG: biotin transporter BioY [Thermodesulfobacteriota bacterium]
MDNSEQLRLTVYASLLAALTAAGAYLIIPIGPVPISLQTLFIYLTGLLLGSRWGAASVAVYLLAGACGLPVFAGGTGGIGRLAGPTGGYLFGYLAAVFVIGLITEKANRRWMMDVAAMTAGTLIIYTAGVFWLKTVTGMTIGRAVTVGMLPFLVGDTLKIIAAVPIVRAVRPLLHLRQVSVEA